MTLREAFKVLQDLHVPITFIPGGISWPDHETTRNNPRLDRAAETITHFLELGCTGEKP